MATLTAVVDVRDKATSKFAKMTTAAARFEQKLDQINTDLNKIEAKLVALTSRRWTIRLNTDNNMVGSAAAGAAARLFSPGPSGGGGGDVPGPDLGDVFDARKAYGLRNERRGGRAAAGGGLRALNRLILFPMMRVGSQAGELFGASFASSLQALFSGAEFAELMTKPTKFVKFTALLGKGVGALAAAALVAVPAVTALSMAISVLGNLIFSLAVPIAAIIPLLTSVGGALAFAGIPLFFWISNTKKLVDQKKQLREQLSKLTPGTAEYAAKLKELNEVQSELDKNGGEYIYAKAMELLEKAKTAIFNPRNNQVFVDTINNILLALEPLIPIVSDLVYKFTSVFRDLFGELAGWIKSSEGESWFQRVFGPDMIRLTRTLGRGIGYLVELFGELSAAIAPVAGRMFEKLNDWMDGLSGRLKSGEAGLGSWLSRMLDVFSLLASVLGQAIKDIANFLADPLIMEYSKRFLEWFKKIVPLTLEWFREVIDRYGPSTITFFKLLGNTIRLAWNVMTAFYSVLQPFLHIIFKILNVFTGTLADAFAKFADAVEWGYNKIENLIGWLKKLLGYAGKFGWLSKIVSAGGWLAGKLGLGGGEDEVTAKYNQAKQMVASGAMPPGITVQNMNVHGGFGNSNIQRAVSGAVQNKAAISGSGVSG